jgi:hypothetical protein
MASSTLLHWNASLFNPLQIVFVTEMIFEVSLELVLFQVGFPKLITARVVLQRKYFLSNQLVLTFDPHKLLLP